MCSTYSFLRSCKWHKCRGERVGHIAQIPTFECILMIPLFKTVLLLVGVHHIFYLYSLLLFVFAQQVGNDFTPFDLDRISVSTANSHKTIG